MKYAGLGDFGDFGGRREEGDRRLPKALVDHDRRGRCREIR